MTESQAFELARARIGRLQPDVLSAVLAVFQAIGTSVTVDELTHLIASGAVDRLLTVLFAARVIDPAAPLRLALREVVRRSFNWNVPYLPNGGRINGTIGVAFDQLNPRVIAAMRTLETRVVSGMTDAMRESVRQAIVRGLEARHSPAAIARTLRDIIGLAPSQEAAVANYRALLEAGDREALSRLLRDRRFDATLERALGKNGAGLSSAQIDTMTTAYRRKSVAANAATISGSATRDAYKMAQRESWQSAIDRGIVDGRSLTKEWVHLPGQRHPRLHHEAMDGERVPFDQPYSNGDTYAGEQDPWNCHCLDLVRAA